MNTSLIEAGKDLEPVFYYRLVCNGEMYEGPHSAKSILGAMLRDERPGEWTPLYAGPIEHPDRLRITAELDDGETHAIEVSGSLIHLKILDEMLKNLRRQIEGCV